MTSEAQEGPQREPKGLCGLGRGPRKEGWGQNPTPTAPVLLLSLPLPPGDSRVSRKVSSGTWTRDSPTPSRARPCGAVTTAAVVSGGRGRSAAGEKWPSGNHHPLWPCPPRPRPAQPPPTVSQELAAAGGYSAGQTASPGAGELSVFLAVPVEAGKHNCVLPRPSDPSHQAAQGAMPWLTALSCSPGSLCLHIPVSHTISSLSGHHVHDWAVWRARQMGAAFLLGPGGVSVR